MASHDHTTDSQPINPQPGASRLLPRPQKRISRWLSTSAASQSGMAQLYAQGD